MFLNLAFHQISGSLLLLNLLSVAFLVRILNRCGPVRDIRPVRNMAQHQPDVIPAGSLGGIQPGIQLIHHHGADVFLISIISAKLGPFLYDSGGNLSCLIPVLGDRQFIQLHAESSPYLHLVLFRDPASVLLSIAGPLPHLFGGSVGKLFFQGVNILLLNIAAVLCG